MDKNSQELREQTPVMSLRYDPEFDPQENDITKILEAAHEVGLLVHALAIEDILRPQARFGREERIGNQAIMSFVQTELATPELQQGLIESERRQLARERKLLQKNPFGELVSGAERAFAEHARAEATLEELNDRLKEKPMTLRPLDGNEVPYFLEPDTSDFFAVWLGILKDTDTFLLERVYWDGERMVGSNGMRHKMTKHTLYLTDENGKSRFEAVQEDNVDDTQSSD